MNEADKIQKHIKDGQQALLTDEELLHLNKTYKKTISIIKGMSYLRQAYLLEIKTQKIENMYDELTEKLNVKKEEIHLTHEGKILLAEKNALQLARKKINKDFKKSINLKEITSDAKKKSQDINSNKEVKITNKDRNMSV